MWERAGLGRHVYFVNVYLVMMNKYLVRCVPPSSFHRQAGLWYSVFFSLEKILWKSCSEYAIENLWRRIDRLSHPVDSPSRWFPLNRDQTAPLLSTFEVIFHREDDVGVGERERLRKSCTEVLMLSESYMSVCMCVSKKSHSPCIPSWNQRRKREMMHSFIPFEDKIEYEADDLILRNTR